MLYVVIFVTLCFAAAAWYALCLRALIINGIARSNDYAPGGRPDARIPFNLACRWTRYFPSTYPHKEYKPSAGVYETP